MPGFLILDPIPFRDRWDPLPLAVLTIRHVPQVLAVELAKADQVARVGLCLVVDAPHL